MGKILHREAAQMVVRFRDDGQQGIIRQVNVVQALAQGFLKAHNGAVEPVIFELLVDIRNPADIDDDLGGGVNLLNEARIAGSQRLATLE